MPLAKPTSVLSTTIDAGDSIYGAGLAYAAVAGVEKVNHIFPELFARQERIRSDWRWQPSKQCIFVAAVDLGSDRQGGLLQKAASAGAVVDSVDYRDYYPSLLPGAPATIPNVPSVGKEGDAAGAERPRPSLAPRIAFLLGGLAARLREAEGATAQILLVAHHFELKDALVELAGRGAEVGIAYYRSLMEPRWERFGLYRADCVLKFYDLAQHVEEITTLGQRRMPELRESSRSAASQLF